MKSSLSRVLPLLLLLTAVNASAKDNSAAHIYSDVHYEEGGTGDLIGTELELKIAGSAATGVVRIYDGRCAEAVPVSGSFSGNTIHVSGEGQGYGKFEIAANFHRGGLEGSLRLERTHSSEKIHLKKIKKAHC